MDTSNIIDTITYDLRNSNAPLPIKMQNKIIEFLKSQHKRMNDLEKSLSDLLLITNVKGMATGHSQKNQKVIDNAYKILDEFLKTDVSIRNGYGKIENEDVVTSDYVKTGEKSNKLRLITIETAKLAKEKGFNIKVHRLGDKNNIQEIPIHLPSQSIVQKWLRDKHQLEVSPRATFSSPQSYVCFVDREIIRDEEFSDLREIGERSGALLDHKIFKSYEEALEEGLNEALKKIK